MALNNKVLFYLLLFLCSLFFCSGEEQDILVLDIEKAKELAIISSEELQYLKLKMLGSWQGYRLGLRQFFPSVDLSFNQSDTVVYYDADTRNKQFSLSFTQLLCDGGRTLLQRRLARLDLYYGEYEYQKKEEEILDSVWELFYKILIGFEKMRLQEELYNVSLEQLEISRVERELGSITEIDLVETEIALKDLEIQMMQTEIEMDSLLYDFKRLLNLGAYDEIELAGSIDSNYSGMDLIQDSEYWFSLMKMENEEIKKMEYELQKKVEQIKMANRSFFPKIEAELSLFILDETFPLQNRGYNLSFSFSFPLKSFPISSSFQMGHKSE
jgi:outer membrane protein TolC